MGENLVRQGVYFRFRYRYINEIGWSDYSPVEFVIAAKEPQRP